MVDNDEPLLGQYAPITKAVLLREHAEPIVSSGITALLGQR